MSAGPVHVRVGTLRVTAASMFEARRLADGLPTAIERSLAARRAAQPEQVRRTGRARRPEQLAEHVAGEIARTVLEALHSGRTRCDT